MNLADIHRPFLRTGAVDWAGARVVSCVMGFVVIVVLGAAPALVMAQDISNPTLIRGEKIVGEKIVELPVPGRKAEICVVPTLFDGASYSTRDTKIMEQLCAIDVRKNAAVCPKLNSTNPGLDIFAIPDGTTAQKFQDTIASHPRAKRSRNTSSARAAAIRRPSWAITMSRASLATWQTCLLRCCVPMTWQITSRSGARRWPARRHQA